MLSAPNEDMAAVDFMSGTVLEGYLPTKALSMVREWITMHRKELKEIWETQEFININLLE